VLEISNLHLWRGERHLLRNVGLVVRAGEALQLLWPNGTGKTSLLRCIAGFLHAEEGQMRWNGVDTHANREAFCWDLAYLGHEVALKGDLGMLENLRYSCALRAAVTDARLRDALTQCGLGALDPAQPVRSLSAGQQRRVALARLSLWGAKLWLLDEPAANLDAAGQQLLSGLLKTHLRSGGLAILATHLPIALDDAHSRTWMNVSEVPA
jgi:heme exporter protein A